MNSRLGAQAEGPSATWKRIAKLWLVLFPVAIGFALLTAIQTWIMERSMPQHDSIWTNFLAYFVLVSYWLALVPLVVQVIRRFPLERDVFVKHLSLHVLTIAALGAAYIFYLWGANMYVIRFLGKYTFAYVPLDTWLRTTALLAVSNAIFRYYIPIAAIGYVAFYRDLSKRRALRAANLENELARAKLQVLRIRLQPHFLFNTLNSISELMHTDIREADRMLALLGELLRVILQSSEDVECVPLRVELDQLRKYMEIQQIRFRERLTVKYAISAECLEIPVPYLLLQPVAENAVKHGVSQRASGGIVKVTATCDKRGLMLTIEDNGPGIHDIHSSNQGTRLGISHTQARLGELYGDTADIQIIYSDAGARVVIVIPTTVPKLEKKTATDSTWAQPSQETHSLSQL